MSICSECGEYKYTHHKCPPQWAAWCEEDGESENDSRYVRALDPEGAAEKYAEEDCDADPEIYSTYFGGGKVISVKTMEGVKKYQVHGEACVNFYAEEG